MAWHLAWQFEAVCAHRILGQSLYIIKCKKALVTYSLRASSVMATPNSYFFAAIESIRIRPLISLCFLSVKIMVLCVMIINLESNGQASIRIEGKAAQASCVGHEHDCRELDDRAELHDALLGLCRCCDARALAHDGHVEHRERAHVKRGQRLARMQTARLQGASVGRALLEEDQVAIEHEQQVVGAVFPFALRVILFIAPHAAPVDLVETLQLHVGQVQVAVPLEKRLAFQALSIESAAYERQKYSI